MRKLFIVWQDSQSRRWFPIGSLSLDTNKSFHFEYTKGALEATKSANFEPLPAFPQMGGSYFSTSLFPTFANRIISPSRGDYGQFIDWIGLTPDEAEPFALLARTAGEKATDSLQLFPSPEKTEDGRYEILFFAHGIRHIPGALEKVEKLIVGDELVVAAEPNNLVDEFALKLLSDQTKIGYIPRYLAPDVHQLVGTAKTHVEKINLPPAPEQFRLLCKLSAPWPANFVPCGGTEFQTLAGIGDVLINNIQPAV